MGQSNKNQRQDMTSDTNTQAARSEAALLNGPWDQLDASGEGLTVNNFLTTWMSLVSNALRRTITLPYAEQYGLTVSEWRVLSLIAHAKRLPFAELVVQSTSDKSLVSRTLRLLEARGLVAVLAEGNTPRKKLTCLITEAGDALHAQVIPIARRRQAEMILCLSPEERQVMLRSLQKLYAVCVAQDGAESALEEP
jgi:DNA-binding MarR family transcriptional regulator